MNGQGSEPDRVSRDGTGMRLGRCNNGGGSSNRKVKMELGMSGAGTEARVGLIRSEVWNGHGTDKEQGLTRWDLVQRQGRKDLTRDGEVEGQGKHLTGEEQC